MTNSLSFLQNPSLLLSRDRDWTLSESSVNTLFRESNANLRDALRASRSLYHLDFEGQYATSESEALRKLLYWGPNGEYVGIGMTGSVTRGMIEDMTRGRVFEIYRDSGMRIQVEGIMYYIRDYDPQLYALHSHRYVPGFRQFAAVKFSDYESMLNFCRLACRSRSAAYNNTPLERWVDFTAEEAEFTSLLSKISFNKNLLSSWLQALDNGYKPGFGVLRDAQDHYDPFGVLADLNLVDWDFNDEENAWMVDGNPFYLPIETIGTYLGVDVSKLSAPMKTQFVALIEQIIEIQDSAKDFKTLLALFKKCIEQDQFLRTFNGEDRRVVGDKRPYYYADDLMSMLRR